MRSLLCGAILSAICVAPSLAAVPPKVTDGQAMANAEKINRAVKELLENLQAKELTKVQSQQLYSDGLEKLRTKWNGTPVLLRILIEDVEWDARHWWGRQRGEGPAATFMLRESGREVPTLELAEQKYRGRFTLPMTEADALKIKKGSLLVVRGEARVELESSRLADDPGGSWLTWWGCDQGLAIDKPTFRIEPPAVKPQ